MNKSKNIILALLLIVASVGANAQNISDALRYSILRPESTARVAGVGGSFGSMGGDIGVMSINPAGLAGFYKSEFTFTPSITSTTTDAVLLADGGITDRSQTNFGLANIAAVFASQPRSGSWTSSNFTIGFQKLADLNKGFAYRGSTVGSYSESLEEIPFILIGTEFTNAELGKEEVVTQKGHVSELNLGWAGNYDNKLDIGISIGIPFVSFDEEKSYREQDVSDVSTPFNQYDRTDYLTTSGAGFNFKAGLIYKGVKPLRIGASIHSPNYYVLTDDFGFADNYTFDDQTTDALTSENDFKYKLKTPWKFNGSVGVLYNLGKLKGFANADVEFLDYSNNEFDLGAYSGAIEDITYGEELNDNVAKELSSVMNVRLGTELAYDKFRFRIGTALSQSPYAIDESDYNSSYSFGLGLREETFFLDFAYVRQTNAEGYLAYVPITNDNDPLVNIDTRKGKMLITAGFKF